MVGKAYWTIFSSFLTPLWFPTSAASIYRRDSGKRQRRYIATDDRCEVQGQKEKTHVHLAHIVDYHRTPQSMVALQNVLEELCAAGAIPGKEGRKERRKKRRSAHSDVEAQKGHTVVFPLPKNPLRIVTGRRLSSFCAFPSASEQTMGSMSAAVLEPLTAREAAAASLSRPESRCGEEGGEDDAETVGEEGVEEADMVEQKKVGQ
jgi:hypothetical protein